MALKIIKSGFRSLVQDQGRLGYHNIGLGISGALDEASYLIGNYLLEHSQITNSIEILLGNFVAQVQKTTNFAITGAQAIVTKNEKIIPMWSRFAAKKGDIIEIKEVTNGNLNYLTVEGGFQIEKFCGSYATNFKLGIGANFGKKLTKQTLLYKRSVAKNSGFFPTKYLLDYWQKKNEQPVAIRVVFYPKTQEFFLTKCVEKFLNSVYTISLESDRAGIHLAGEKIYPKKTSVLSAGLTFGTIQVQTSGIPIILMKDCQTIGGYPKIGYICTLDSFLLAQLRVKQQIRFVKINAQESQAITKNFYQKFSQLRARRL